jgi:hypothetical protein
MKMTVCWNVAPFIQVECYRSFGETYCLQFQGMSFALIRQEEKLIPQSRQEHIQLPES